MKALVLEANQSLKYQEVSDPRIASDECLVAVKKVGICNSDIYRAFDNGAYFYPLIMGHEFAGIVEEAGSSVTKFKKGDQVAVFPLIPCKTCEFCRVEHYAQCTDYDYYGSRRHGAFAQFISVKEWNLFPIPDEVKLEEAALLEPLSVAFHSVRKLSFNKNDSVAILGAGVIGLTIAKYLSNIVDSGNLFLIDRNDFKLSIAEQYGAITINSLSEKDWLRELTEKSGGGVNKAIEACGAVFTYEKSLEMVKSHGQILWVGNITGDLKLSKKTVSSLLRREIEIFGCWNSRFNHTSDDDWHYSLRFIREEGVKELISHQIDLKKGKTVFDNLYLNKVKRIPPPGRPFLKVVLDIE